MRKLTFLFTCLLLAIPCWSEADVNLVDLVKRVRPAVVTVITYDKEKNLLGQGSGFFVDGKGHLITNYHVLRGAYSAEIKTFDGKEYPVKLVLAESEEADLIKVSMDISGRALKFVRVTNAIPEVAERVIVVGSPMGLEQTVSEGIVSAVRDIPTIGKIFQISAPVSPGSSGSPVLNMKGQVIGVASFQLIAGQNLNFAVSGGQVLALKSEKKGKTLAEWTSGVSKQEIDAAENPYQQGLKFVWAGEYEKALDYFKKAIENNNRFALAWFSAGFCYSELGRYQEAIEAYKQAIHIKPDFADAHYNLGITYAELDRHQEAIEAYKQAIRIKPDYADAHYNLGIIYGKLGQHQEAIEAYKQAINIKPDYAKAYYGMGWVYDKIGLDSEAIEAYKQAIRIKPNLADAHYSLGIIYGKLGQHQEAIEACKQAIRIKPDYADAHFGLGVAYGEFGRYQEAIEAFKQAIRIKPDYADAHYNLGITYAELDRHQEAIEAYKQAIRIKPDYALAHYNLGISYLTIGGRGSALDEYQILKTLDKELANILFNSIYK